MTDHNEDQDAKMRRVICRIGSRTRYLANVIPPASVLRELLSIAEDIQEAIAIAEKLSKKD